MKRLVFVAGLVGLSTGCMSLDFMFLDTRPTRAYSFDHDLVPTENVELVQFDRGDGTQLQGVWLRQDPILPAPPLIFFHGNSGNLEDFYPRLEYYWTWGYDVFAPEYSGFGASEGEASWENLHDHDGVAAIDYVSTTTAFASDDIPMVALSLGGFVAIHAVDERPAQALVLQSVFANSDLLLDTSLKLDVPDGWFFEDQWENDVAISEIGGTPVLIIHGLADDFVDPSSGPILFDAARGDRELWQPKGVDHADLWEVEPDEYRARSEEFFLRYFP